MTDTTEQATTETVTATTTAATANTDSTTATAPPAGEGQGDAGNTAETTEASKTDEAEAEQQGAPEAYTAFTLPDGFELAGARLDEAQALFKELGLPQASAQKAIDAFVKMQSENAATLEQAVSQQIETWGKQSRDTFGDKYDAMVTDARTAVTAVKSEALTEAFNQHGWGNHPELIRAFAYFGKLIGEGQMSGIGGEATTGGQPKSMAERMYPNMK